MRFRGHYYGYSAEKSKEGKPEREKRESRIKTRTRAGSCMIISQRQGSCSTTRQPQACAKRLCGLVQWENVVGMTQVRRKRACEDGALAADKGGSTTSTTKKETH